MGGGHRMATDDDRKLLRDNTFLGCLAEAAFDQVHRKGHRARFRKGETIFRRGDEGASMMLILSGSVKVFNTTADGREAVLNFLGPADVIGEITILDGLERTASVTALEATETFSLQRRDIIPTLLANPEAMLEVIQMLCGKLRNTSSLVEDGLNEMPGRTARGLLRLADQLGRQTREGIVIQLQVSQRDLGNYMGLSRENTSRQLATLRQQGIISIDQEKIVIHRRAELEALAEAGRDR
jgi:CRP/FNR family cyclic AMP-dependent transcriptional regulator